jgi:hypothetical protein
VSGLGSFQLHHVPFGRAQRFRITIERRAMQLFQAIEFRNRFA